MSTGAPTAPPSNCSSPSATTPLTVDPDTGVPVERVLHAPAVHFKGKGFYNTDYGTRNRKRETAAAAADKSSTEKSDKTAEKSSGEKSTSDSSSGTGTGSSSSSEAKTEKSTAKPKESKPVPSKS